MKTAKWIVVLSVISMIGVPSADAWSKDSRVARSRAANTPAETPDRSQFDCREVVGRTITRPAGRNARQIRVHRECPHVEQMQAGLCETHWFKGMRCIE